MQDKIRGIIAENLCVDVKTISADTNIFDDLGADSLDIVEIVMALESAFGITITDDEVNNVCTVEDIYRLVECHL